MVFFTCNTCGASLKKNQVEKHYQNECPNCQVLSCMDCGKDFRGDEYAAHTKCISEAQKYQGALYKESSGKGEKKQQEWLEKVKQSVCSASVSPRVAGLLERIADYPNIPRKKAKFENFVKNSFNVRDQRTLSELWEAFSGATNTKQHSKSENTTLVKQQTACSSANTDVSSNGTSTPQELKQLDRELTSREGSDCASTLKDRSKKKNRKHESDSGEGEAVDRSKKKKKKHKRESDSMQGEEVDKSKKKRKRESDSGEGEEVEDTSDDTDAEGTAVPRAELEHLQTDTPTKRKKHKHRIRKEHVEHQDMYFVSQELENDGEKSCTVMLSKKKMKHRHSVTEDLQELPPVKKRKQKYVN